jgi:hypothetical protein
VIHVGPGDNPDVMVRLPDETYLALAMSATDYLAGPSPPPPGHSPPPAYAASQLLSLAGLRAMGQLVARMRAARAPAVTAPGEPTSG